MNIPRIHPWLRPAVVAAALVVVAVPAWAQGTVTGQITDQSSGQPVVGARVIIVGTALIAQTNADGRYALAGVPAGPATLRVSAIGYAAGTRTVAVSAGATATADLGLTLSAYTLDAIVTTATGDQAKRELGHSIAGIDAADRVATKPITSLNDLLVGQAAGVQVAPGNITGAEARIRIRGLNSLSLGNGPIYYIDGVRIESGGGSSTIGIGGTDLSRLNDVNPDEIESIEIVRGPSAATLYGTDAANGVVVIKTKRGRAGAPRWNVYSELGAIKDYNDWPVAYRAWTAGSTAGNGTQCFLSQAAAGSCVQDSITTFNLFDDPDASPNGTGWRGQVGAQVSGGSDVARYFLSGEYEDEIGQLRMPNFAYGRVLRARNLREVPYEEYRPNELRRVSVAANIQATLNPKLDVSVSTRFVSSSTRLPQTDNNTTGLLSNGLGGPGHKTNFDVSGNDTVPLFGFRAFTPDEFFADVTTQDVDRFIGSGTADWRPNAWLSARLSGGLDFTSEVSEELCRRGDCVDFGTIRLGFKSENRASIHRYTLDGNLAASYALSPSVRAKTTAGLQYFERTATENAAFGENLPGGAGTVGAGVLEQAGEATTETKTLGVFAEQQFSLNERLFVTGAVRMDDNSAFGKDFSAVVYPKLSVSWVLTDEPFFRSPSWLSSLRLRGAVGASGQQPGSTDALVFFEPTSAAVDGEDQPAIVFSAIGKTDLKPERATEYEVGFDAGFLESRLNLDFTFYRRLTKDALISRVLAPSLGAAASRFENLGSVRNSGVEASLNAVLLNQPNLGWDVSIAGSYNSNEIVDFGKDELGEDVPPIIGTTIHQREGYPIDSYWLRPILGYNDLNGNGRVEANEIVVGDSAAFIGPNVPKAEITITNGFDLFSRKLRISALMDFKGGKYQLNGSERIRCESRLNCDGLIDPNAPIWKQVRTVALREHPSRTQWGFVEKADFWRLRELSLTYQLPDSWAQAMRASRVSVTAAGRNLFTVTDYSGMDPESGYFDGDTQTDFQTAPPPTYWTFRVNVAF